MKQAVFTLFLVLWFPFLFRAQSPSYSVALYYHINEISSEQNTKRLDSLLKLVGESSTQVSIYAYADFLSNPSYNLQLSKKRLEVVQTQIFASGAKHLVLKEAKAFGDVYSKNSLNANGEPDQRRVDVLLIINEGRKKIREKPLETQKQESATKVKEKNTLKDEHLVKTSSELERTIKDMKEGESLAIEGLSFIPGKHILMKSSVPILEQLVEVLKDNEDLKIEIQGHICCMPESNADGLDYDTGTWDLSEKRAEAVYNYLIRNGIEKTRLSYKGYGHRFPKVSPERTPEDEQLNRRVEIKVLEN